MSARLSMKHIQISKANAVMVGVISVGVFLVIFSVFSIRALVDQRTYQNRVLNGKETALRQLRSNLEAAQNLAGSYETFVNRPDNIINGVANGNSDRDGDNSKIILDALPSKYDFPGLISSLEKVLTDNNFNIVGVSGEDNELQEAETSTASPEPVGMPFTISVEGSYDSVQRLLLILERSIRPINIKQLDFSGGDDNIQLDITAKSYYLPSKRFEVLTREVK